MSAAAAVAGRRTGEVVLTGVAKTYRTESGAEVEAVTPTDLTIAPGEFVCVVGPSGCGKSTVMDLVAGFLAPTSGRITVDGRPVTGPGAERGVVFQQPNLLPWLTVRANVELGPRLRGVPAAERRARAGHFLELVGLEHFADRKPYELSGGMQQRCQIARVLTNDPEIILMDEPFGALDALTRERMQDELLSVWREGRKTVLFITHDVDEAVFLGNRVLVMSARPGRVVLDLPVRLGGERSGAELRSLPEFVRLRDRVAAAITAAHGTTDHGTTDHGTTDHGARAAPTT